MIPVASMKAFTAQIAVTQRENGRQIMVETAKAEEAKVLREQTQRAGGIAPTFVRIVDGQRGAPYEAVRENGVIIIQWKYLREIAAKLMARLRQRAPERSGAYKRGIKLFVGDTEAGLSAGGIPPNATKITTVATVPYSRRLEAGKRAGGGPFVLRVAPHIVEETAKFFEKDYRGVAKVTFTYEDVAGPAGASTRRSTGSRRRDRARDANLRHPAIRVVDDR